MTRRGSIVIYGALLLCAAVSLLVSSSAAALGALILLCLFPLLSLAWNAFARRGLHASITAPTFASKDESVQGAVRIQCGRLRAPAGQFTVQAELLNELTGTNETLLLVPLPQDNAYIADFSFTSRHCGCIRICITAVHLGDVFDLIRLRSNAQASARCTILPHTFPVEIADPAMPNDARDADAYLDVGGGSDFTEVYRLREYVPGDPIRGMHWKLSSKLDTLLYRDPSLAVQRSLLLFWDRARTSPDVADALAEAVFSVSQALSEQGITFTLAVPQADAPQLQAITDEQSLLQTLPLLLRDAGNTQVFPDLSGFARTFWFTSRDTVPASESVTVLTCTENTDADVHGIVFTPQTVRETLHRLD